MRKKFLIEVPCTVMDRYYIFAESKEDARRKMDSDDMREQTREKFGDYLQIQRTDDEPETHWERAVFIKEVEETDA